MKHQFSITKTEQGYQWDFVSNTGRVKESGITTTEAEAQAEIESLIEAIDGDDYGLTNEQGMGWSSVKEKQEFESQPVKETKFVDDGFEGEIVVQKAESVIVDNLDYAHIANCLHVRELCQPYHDVYGEYESHHLGMVEYHEGKEAKQREVALANEGDKYYAQGYRLNQTPRSQDSAWKGHLPENYLYAKEVTAGHIAMVQAYRYVYITKVR